MHDWANTQGLLTSNPLPVQLSAGCTIPSHLSLWTSFWTLKSFSYVASPRKPFRFLAGGGECWCSEHLVWGSLVAPVTIHLGVHSDILTTNADHAPTTRHRNSGGPVHACGTLSYLILHHNLARWRLLLALPLQNPEVQRSEVTCPVMRESGTRIWNQVSLSFFLKRKEKALTHTVKK